MSDTPDLSKVVGLIMQNPALIEQISSLVKSEQEPGLIAEQKEEDKAAPSVSASVTPNVSKNVKRQRLLSALKPYLRDERARAIDSMLSVAEILDMIRSK